MAVAEEIRYAKNSWYQMKHRCLNPRYKDYPRYGGRGIKLCERWMSFENFLADMGGRRAGQSIDRIDVNGDYTPENCRWADIKTQNKNRTTTSFVTINGVTKCVTDWCKIFNICRQTVVYRHYELGMSWEESLTKPLARKRKNSRYNKDNSWPMVSALANNNGELQWN